MHRYIEACSAGTREIDEGYFALNLGGRGRCVILCDHASNHVPEDLGTLGLTPSDLERAIAYDIGAACVAEMLSLRLDAPVVSTTTSRLVIDSNRPIGSPESIPTYSEDTDVPGNRSLSEDERARRADAYFWPYHQRIQELLDERERHGLESWIICLHSFTPVFAGVPRRWHVGFTYDRETALAKALISTFSGEDDLVVGDNEPYPIDADGDYSLPVHSEARGLPGVLIEIRQDLIKESRGARRWANRLGAALASAKIR